MVLSGDGRSSWNSRVRRRKAVNVEAGFAEQLNLE